MYNMYTIYTIYTIYEKPQGSSRTGIFPWLQQRLRGDS